MIHAHARQAADSGGRHWLYYRALVRGMSLGRRATRAARLDRVAERGVEALHRWLTRVDPASAVRIQPR